MSHPDLGALLNALLPYAQQMLEKHGEFFPFAASMSSAGEIALAASYSGDEHPESQAVIDLSIQGLRERATRGEIRASGVCVDVRAIAPGQSKKTDAIETRLEHANGEAVNVFLPYQKGFRGKLKYGDIFASSGTPSVFAHDVG